MDLGTDRRRVLLCAMATLAVSGCGKPTPGSQPATAVPAVTSTPRAGGDAAVPPADASATRPALIETTPPLAADTAVVPADAPADEPDGATHAAETAPSGPVDHCAGLVALLAAQDPANPALMKERKRPCKVIASLEAPPVSVVSVHNLPTMEGEWSPSRVAVASGNTWFASPILGIDKATVVTAGPAEGMFHVVYTTEVFEPGSGGTTVEKLYVCRVAKVAGSAPRCAEREVGRTEKPTDGAPGGEAQDWKIAWRFTADGLHFDSPRGKNAPDPKTLTLGDVTFEAFLATGADLERE